MLLVSLVGLGVEFDEAEALGPAAIPFEVVDETPVIVTHDGVAEADGAPHFAQVGEEEAGAKFIGSVGDAVFGDVDGFAEAVDCPVVLIADIDRGGVFAHLVGTLDVLAESEQNRIVGFIINKFRGDIALLEPGLEWLEQRTGKPVLGVLPFLPDFFLDAEDAIATEQAMSESAALLRVVVPVLPRISNHTDFDALAYTLG